MDSFTGMSIDNCERNIKFNRKWVRYQLLWLLFIVCLTCFDGQTLMSNHSIFGAINFGMILVTFLWSLVFFLESWNELKNEKRKLRFLTELHETQMASGERKEYLNLKNYYERLIEENRKNQVLVNPILGKATSVDIQFK